MGRKKRGQLLQYIEYLIVLCLVKSFSIIPYKLASDIGGYIGRLGYYIDKKHRHISLRNLQMTFPEKDKKDITRIAKRAFENLGRSAAEVIHIASHKTPRIQKALYDWVTIEGRDNLDRAVKKGMGALFLTAHFGNWELLGVAMGACGHPFNAIARPLDNPRLNSLFNSLRSVTGTKVIQKKGALREILKRLKNGEWIGILIDQNTSRNEGVFVDFFKHPAATSKGPALIAMKGCAPVIPFFILREGKYSHRIIYGPEVPVNRDGEVESDVVSNTERFTKIVESYIRRYPEQWLWMHQRWKTRPE